MATIKLQPSGKVVIKDGKVSCGCCEELCGPVFYTDMFGATVYADKENSYEISKEQFDLVQDGGAFNGSASISVNFSPQLNCSFSANSNTITAGQNEACSTLGITIFRGDDISSSPTCINDPLYYGPPPLPSEVVYSSMEFVFFFLKQEDKYYFHISGYIQCPVGNGTASCFSQFKNVGKVYSTGTINFFSIFGANIYYDDNSAFTSNSWSISFT